MSFLRNALAKSEERYSVDQWAYDAANFGMLGGPQAITTWKQDRAEAIGNNFTGYVSGIYKQDGPVFACIAARMLLFSEVRFTWQDMENGRPGDLSWTPQLTILDTPWENATTGSLLARMEQHDSLAGNAYVLRQGNRLKVLRPDWVSIVVGSPSGDPDDLASKPLGYLYWPGGPGKNKPVTLLPEDIAHYSTTPDPEAEYRGMSWLTPVLREVQGDQQATKHKLKFFENAATPNLAVSLSEKLTPEVFKKFVAEMSEKHDGVDQAYKTLYLGGGADVTVVGADLKQLDFKSTQGAGETRIASASRVPAIIAGLSEGLDASTYSNFGQARRQFADGFARPAWRTACGALQSIAKPPAGKRLWYDATDVSYLQEDEKDGSTIMAAQASTISTLVQAGYTPDSATKAVLAGDLSILEHSGLFSVQLQKPGSEDPATA